MTFGQRLGPSLVTLVRSDGLPQRWSLGKTRKPTQCAHCHEPLPSQALAYRPATAALNRSTRLCRPCVDALEQAQGQER